MRFCLNLIIKNWILDIKIRNYLFIFFKIKIISKSLFLFIIVKYINNKIYQDYNLFIINLLIS